MKLLLNYYYTIKYRYKRWKQNKQILVDDVEEYLERPDQKVLWQNFNSLKSAINHESRDSEINSEIYICQLVNLKHQIDNKQKTESVKR